MHRYRGQSGSSGASARTRQLLISYMAYYDGARTHLSLNKDAPISRSVRVVGRVCANPSLGGLHHHYVPPLPPTTSLNAPETRSARTYARASSIAYELK